MKTIKAFMLATVAATVMASAGAGVSAQTSDGAVANKTRQRLATKSSGETTPNAIENSKSQPNSEGTAIEPAGDPAGIASNGATEQGVTSLKPSTDPVVPADQGNRHEQASEDAAIVPYYNNFFNTYRLGPEDVVSVSVFGQDRYSRSGIIVPPSGRISLALIPGGVFVNGKTVDEVAELVRKSYDEYIIDPQVTVSLDKASSYRYSVIGDVAQPGIRLMNRRLTVTEALGEAGGVLQTGDRSKVVVLRRQADGNLTPIAVNVSAIYKGKAPDIVYLVPGDQVLVPGNKFKTFQKVMTLFPILSFARIFAGGGVF
ncbi:MAG TPA: polysaccharide biosynthesis/export family protein [Pyrinomonadaceae bacterium]|nr:polysaccharide biosynthesis/export family protein [Pyrinomonadaceae bacterium]